MPKLGNDVAFTGHAMRALQLSIAFSQTFRGPEAAPVAHTLDLDTPPGTSTGGGENVTQTVKLTVGRTNAISVAVVNAAARRAEIASYESAADAFAKANGGAPFPFEVAEYSTIVAKLEAFFARERVTTPNAASPPPMGGAQASAPRAGRSRVAIVVVVAAAMVLLVTAAALALR